MRVRVLLGVAVALVVGALILDMSGRAQRTAGSNHIDPAAFSATTAGGGVVCQPIASLPGDAAGVRLLLGTYGRPAPALGIQFLAADGASVAEGRVAAGAREGNITIPLRRTPGAAAAAARACVSVGGSSPVALGGETGPVDATAELIDGKPQPGRLSLFYLRSGDESWWQLLPELSHRFGLGKASFFGPWTLPVAALLLLGVWAGALRLLARELT